MPNFKTSFSIGKRPVGGTAPVLIIAEAGVAHFGDMDLARQLVEMSAAAGADVFKIQLFDVDALFAASAEAWRDRLRPRNLTLDQAMELKAACESRGLLFMATAHDETRLPWLETLQVPAVKIGSGERNNTQFLRRMARMGLPVILSTGMYDTADVDEALAVFAEEGCDRVALLHCVTSYPTPPEQVNLAAMDALAARFPGPVGFSDHTVDHLAVLGAVARGARIVEKHITILRDVPNAQDWKVSCGPEDFGRFVADVRRMETMVGSAEKKVLDCERPALEWALKSLVAARALEPGHPLAEDDLVAKRPAGGIPPNRLSDVMGRRLRTTLAADQALRWEDLQ